MKKVVFLALAFALILLFIFIKFSFNLGSNSALAGSPSSAKETSILTNDKSDGVGAAVAKPIGLYYYNVDMSMVDSFNFEFLLDEEGLVFSGQWFDEKPKTADNIIFDKSVWDEILKLGIADYELYEEKKGDQQVLDQRVSKIVLRMEDGNNISVKVKDDSLKNFIFDLLKDK